MLRRLSSAWLALSLIPSGAIAAPQDAPDAGDLFTRMRAAVHQTDYEGRFVYQVGDHLDGMYVVHRVRNGHELERLVALDGEPKEVIRGEQGVACLEPRRRHISVVGNRAGLRDAEPPDLAHLRRFYEFHLLGPVRAAGRPALRIEIRPRDRARFGYRIDLDERTALPLRSAMFEHDGSIRSQTLFVELKTGEEVTPIEMDLSALELTRIPPTVAPRPPPHPPEESEWRFRALPDGFRLITEGHAEGGSHHFVFTDGLASVSLYVEPAPEAGEALEGFSRIGATEAYAAVRHGHQFVAVGEVPRRTLEAVAAAAEPR